MGPARSNCVRDLARSTRKYPLLFCLRAMLTDGVKKYSLDLSFRFLKGANPPVRMK